MRNYHTQNWNMITNRVVPRNLKSLFIDVIHPHPSLTETHFTFPTNFGYRSNYRTETLRMVSLVALLTQHDLGIVFRLPAHLAHTTVRALPSSSHTYRTTYKEWWSRQHTTPSVSLLCWGHMQCFNVIHGLGYLYFHQWWNFTPPQHHRLAASNKSNFTYLPTCLLN